MSGAASAQPIEASANDVALQIATRLKSAWDAGDRPAWANQYWPDSQFINVFGSILDGQEQIATRHSEVFTSTFRGMELTFQVRHIRVLRAEHILVDLDLQTMTARDATPPGQSIQTRLKNILERRGTIWKIIASQNTRVVESPF
jgi:uncharacterized protein (TIGR02246 family)